MEPWQMLVLVLAIAMAAFAVSLLRQIIVGYRDGTARRRDSEPEEAKKPS